jgi:PadR family transcriptional regulator AphA
MSRANQSYYAILGILGFGPMSGYQIKMWVDQGVGGFWDVDYKQIYPTLKRFIDEGLATCQEEATGKRKSKRYELTAKGHTVLRDWLRQPIADGKHSVNELMLKLFFGHHLPVEQNIEHIKRFQEENLRVIEAMEGIRNCLADEEPKDASWHYRMAIFNHGEKMRRANLAWCEQTIKYLRKSMKE